MIHIIDNNISPEICNEMIRRFDLDDGVVDGYLGLDQQVDYDIKRCDELSITGREDWNDIDQEIYNSATIAIAEYIPLIKKEYKIDLSFDSDTGYKIKRYQPKDNYYHWHHDSDIRSRVISMLWYLNDVDEGGETEFVSGEMITPKQGRVVMFPATWSYVHRGLPPISNVKYAMTTFLTC